MPGSRFQRSPSVDVDRTGEDVILLHTESLELRVLNPAAAVLWDALEEFGTLEELTDLLVSADPDTPAEVHRQRTAEFLKSLGDGGFIRPEGP